MVFTGLLNVEINAISITINYKLVVTYVFLLNQTQISYKHFQKSAKGMYEVWTISTHDKSKTAL